MNYMPSNAELRARARAQLQGRWGVPILACLIIAIIVGSIGLLIGPIMVGGAVFFSRFVRKGDTELELMFRGFRDFGGTLCLGLIHLLIISAIVFAPTMIISILNVIAYTYESAIALLAVVVLVIATSIATAVISYGLAPIYYVKVANPMFKSMECIRKSWGVMRGHKWEFFCLNFSFIGWGILSLLTFGIGYIWLMPYIETTKANYMVVLLRNAGLMEMPTEDEEFNPQPKEVTFD